MDRKFHCCSYHLRKWNRKGGGRSKLTFRLQILNHITADLHLRLHVAQHCRWINVDWVLYYKGKVAHKMLDLLDFTHLRTSGGRTHGGFGRSSSPSFLSQHFSYIHHVPPLLFLFTVAPFREQACRDAATKPMYTIRDADRVKKKKSWACSCWQLFGIAKNQICNSYLFKCLTYFNVSTNFTSSQPLFKICDCVVC